MAKDSGGHYGSGCLLPIVVFVAILVIASLAFGQTTDSLRFYSGTLFNSDPKAADAQDSLVCRMLRHALAQAKPDTIEIAIVKTWTITPDAIEFIFGDNTAGPLDIWVRPVGQDTVECDYTLVTQVFSKASPVKQRRWEYKVYNGGEKCQTTEYRNVGNAGLTTKKNYNGKDLKGRPNGLPDKYWVDPKAWGLNKERIDKEKAKKDEKEKPTQAQSGKDKGR